MSADPKNSRIGSPVSNPRSQLLSTSVLRIFVQADEQDTLLKYLGTVRDLGMQHFSGNIVVRIDKMGNIDSSQENMAHLTIAQ
jgi:hypothetical protein